MSSIFIAFAPSFVQSNCFVPFPVIRARSIFIEYFNKTICMGMEMYNGGNYYPKPDSYALPAKEKCNSSGSLSFGSGYFLSEIH